MEIGKCYKPGLSPLGCQLLLNIYQLATGFFLLSTQSHCYCFMTCQIEKANVPEYDIFGELLSVLKVSLL